MAIVIGFLDDEERRRIEAAGFEVEEVTPACKEVLSEAYFQRGNEDEKLLVVVDVGIKMVDLLDLSQKVHAHARELPNSEGE